MYPAKPEIKDMIESNTSESYLILLLSSEKDGQLPTPFTTNVVILTSISHIFNILSSPAYGDFMSTPIR